jgi:hypothetical protein
MSDLAKELGAGCLTSEQVDAITHAWLDLCASQEQFESDPQSNRRIGDELAIACSDSIEEIEKAFPFLLEGVEDE